MRTKTMMLLFFSFSLLSNQDRVIEGKKWYSEKIQSYRSQESTSNYTLTGVGDFSWTHIHTGKPTTENTSLKKTPLKTSLLSSVSHQELMSGDFNFINIESPIGTFCHKIRSTVSFYFFMSPSSLRELIGNNYNILSLANNHTRDCMKGKAFSKSETKYGPLMSLEVLRAVEKENFNFIYNGVFDSKNTKGVTTKKILTKSNEEVSVGFLSLSILSWDIPNSHSINYSRENPLKEIDHYLQRFTDQDIKILSIHTQDSSGHYKREGKAFKLLKKIGEIFIKKYNGDVVFGHGPHTWGGVKVLNKKNKAGKGIILTSLGNYIHQGLRRNTENYQAIVHIDKYKKTITGVRLKRFSNERSKNKKRSFIHPREFTSDLPLSNFQWFRDDGSIFAYFN